MHGNIAVMPIGPSSAGAARAPGTTNAFAMLIADRMVDYDPSAPVPVIDVGIQTHVQWVSFQQDRHHGTEATPLMSERMEFQAVDYPISMCPSDDVVLSRDVGHAKLVA